MVVSVYLAFALIAAVSLFVSVNNPRFLAPNRPIETVMTMAFVAGSITVLQLLPSPTLAAILGFASPSLVLLKRKLWRPR